MLCRKRLNRHRNQVDLAARDQVQQEPVYGLDGDRQIGGASLAQAFMRNMGTWRFDAKGVTRAETPQGFEYRGGAQGRTARTVVGGRFQRLAGRLARPAETGSGHRPDKRDTPTARLFGPVNEHPHLQGAVALLSCSSPKLRSAVESST
jgi:hypothetical protein